MRSMSASLSLMLVFCGATAVVAQNKSRAEVRPEVKGLIPLDEISASDRYKGEDGGLYGGGQNRPPQSHRKAAEAEIAKIRPLDAEGKPSASGRIVFISLS